MKQPTDHQMANIDKANSVPSSHITTSSGKNSLQPETAGNACLFRQTPPAANYFPHCVLF
jgi:hypothetical protein